MERVNPSPRLDKIISTIPPTILGSNFTLISILSDHFQLHLQREANNPHFSRLKDRSTFARSNFQQWNYAPRRERDRIDHRSLASIIYRSHVSIPIPPSSREGIPPSLFTTLRVSFRAGDSKIRRIPPRNRRYVETKDRPPKQTDNPWKGLRYLLVSGALEWR